MPETLARAGFTTDAFEAFLAARREPEWLVDLRRQSWKKFEELPVPSRNEEEWRRTDVRMLRLDRFAFPLDSAASEPSAEPLLSQGVELGGRTVAHGSAIVRQELNSADASRGVYFGSLDAAVHTHGDLIRRHLLTRAVNPAADKFAALHGAAWSGGTLLYVPRGVVIEQPLHIFSALADTGVDFGHTLVILEDDSEVTLLAEQAGGAESSLHCGAIEIFVGSGARLRYVNLQNWGPGVWHFAHQKAILARDASMQWTIGALGSRLAKVNQHVALAGEGASAQVNGVMFTEGKQHLSYHTLQHHEAPGCHSDLLYKGGLQDASRVVWRGMIKVDPNAQKTDAYQRNDNLMLSEDSRADSIPGLEIQADDVRCTHGATAGRVDDDQIFYLRARGLTRNEAVRAIVAGFFQQVFDRITIEGVREALGQAIGRRIRHYN